jgi:hypothetical protein
MKASLPAVASFRWLPPRRLLETVGFGQPIEFLSISVGFLSPRKNTLKSLMLGLK